MPFLPEAIISLLAAFEACFTKPSWQYAQTLLIGAILCTGKRTVTSCLRVMGLSNEPHYDRYHSFLSKSKFSEFQLVKILLGLLIVMLPHNCPILIAMDETIERRKGSKIKAKGCYRDACRSTHNLVIRCFGLKWQCAALLIKLPWNDRTWALPFMTVLCHPKKYADPVIGYKVISMSSENYKLNDNIGYYNGNMYYVNAEGINIQFTEKLNQQLIKNTSEYRSSAKRNKCIKKNIDNLGNKNMKLFTLLCGQHKLKHRTSVDYAILMMKKISLTLKRPWVFLGDGGFTSIKLGLACASNNVTLISRLKLNAALYEPAPAQIDGKRGRKRLKGDKAPSLHELIKNDNLVWQEQEIDWYKDTRKKVRLSTGTNLWYTTRYKPLSIRWVVVQDIESGKCQAFFSTDVTLSAAIIVEYFVLRWNIETTFEEVRSHLGVETQRQWSDTAIHRTTPMLMGLFSLTCIIAYKLTKGTLLPAISTAWYKKSDQATFSDVITYVKQAISRKKQLNACIINDDFVQIPRKDFDEIINLGLLVA